MSVFGPGLIQLITSGTLKMQYGTIGTTAIGASGSLDITITLPTAWTNNHFAFFASGLPSVTWSGFYLAGASPNGSLTTGLAHWINGGTPQNIINGWWISFGN